MKKIFLIAIILFTLFVSPKTASAQYYFFSDEYQDNPILFEAGISLNLMNSLTDIGGKKGLGAKYFKDLNLGYSHFSGGIFFNAIYQNAVAMRLEATFGKISANDNVLKGVTDIAKERYNRNLNFTSNISEIALVFELHPLYIFIDWPSKENPPPRASPYLLGGVGYFSFNPQTKLGGKVIDLQSLHTEGQGFAEYPDRPNYKLSQANIPLGFGVKYELSPLVNLRGEFIYRKLSTDYLDDLSQDYIDPALFDKYFTPEKALTARALYDRQINKKAGIKGKRGTPTNNDGYFTFNIKASVILGRLRNR